MGTGTIPTVSAAPSGKGGKCRPCSISEGTGGQQCSSPGPSAVPGRRLRGVALPHVSLEQARLIPERLQPSRAILFKSFG